MSLTSGRAANTVKTALDDVMEDAMQVDREREPQEVIATNSIFFMQKDIDRQALVLEDLMGPGLPEAHVEEQEVNEASPRVDNQKTHTILNYKQDLPISREYFDDDQHTVVDDLVREMGLNARLGRDKHAYEQSYGDAFSGVTSSDGVALISNSHTTLSGDTVDNLETGALSPANLKTLIKSLRLQKKQDGELGAYNAAGLLVSPTDYPEAVEITEAELKPQSTDNDPNFLSLIYPGMAVGTSAFLDSTYNSLNSNTDTSYFVVARQHGIMRIERQGLSTDLIDWRLDKRDRYFYKARFREVVSAQKFNGVVGSNGTA